MTLTDALYAYARALEEKHLRAFLRFSVASPANDNVHSFHHFAPDETI